MLRESGIKFSCKTYASFEYSQIALGEGIGLGNNGNKIDTCAETLHNLDIQRLQAIQVLLTAYLEDIQEPTHV